VHPSTRAERFEIENLSRVPGDAYRSPTKDNTMKFLVSLIGLFLAGNCVNAAFLPLTLQEKSEKADLIVVGKAVSVTRLLPNETDGSVEAQDADYYGPAGVAVIHVTEVWKRPKADMRSFTLEPFKSVVPKYIMVPCDYSFSESPSDISTDVTYVLFLRQIGDNFFHPLDPASTHVVSKGRVANFGMNHPPTERVEFAKNSTPVPKFKEMVHEHIAANEPTKEPDGGEPSDAPKDRASSIDNGIPTPGPR